MTCACSIRQCLSSDAVSGRLTELCHLLTAYATGEDVIQRFTRRLEHASQGLLGKKAVSCLRYDHVTYVPIASAQESWGCLGQNTGKRQGSDETRLLVGRWLSPLQRNSILAAVTKLRNNFGKQDTLVRGMSSLSRNQHI